MIRARYSISLCCILLSTVLGGCGGGGDGVERFDLSGNVTFDGNPIVFGQIDFFPDQERGNSGPQGFAQIVDGKYDTAMNGKGVIKGPHEVRITAYEERPPIEEDETLEIEGPEPLFVGYTIKDELAPSTKDFAVPAEARGYNHLAPGAQQRGGGAP